MVWRRDEGGFVRPTFEVTPTTEAGAVSPDCENAGQPQAGLTAPAVVGRGVDRGVRPRWRAAAGLDAYSCVHDAPGGVVRSLGAQRGDAEPVKAQTMRRHTDGRDHT